VPYDAAVQLDEVLRLRKKMSKVLLESQKRPGLVKIPKSWPPPETGTVARYEAIEAIIMRTAEDVAIDVRNFELPVAAESLDDAWEIRLQREREQRENLHDKSKLEEEAREAALALAEANGSREAATRRKAEQEAERLAEACAAAKAASDLRQAAEEADARHEAKATRRAAIEAAEAAASVRDQTTLAEEATNAGKAASAKAANDLSAALGSYKPATPNETKFWSLGNTARSRRRAGEHGRSDSTNEFDR